MFNAHIISKGCYDSRTQKASRVMYVNRDGEYFNDRENIEATNAFQAEILAMEYAIDWILEKKYDEVFDNVYVTSNNKPLVQKLENAEYCDNRDFNRLLDKVKKLKKTTIQWEAVASCPVCRKLKEYGEEICK